MKKTLAFVRSPLFRREVALTLGPPAVWAGILWISGAVKNKIDGPSEIMSQVILVSISVGIVCFDVVMTVLTKE